MKLWYSTPAEKWTEALPVGNGRLGAMIFGGAHAEHLQLNEATLWSGEPTDGNNPAARQILPKLREAVFAGKYHDADKLAAKMQGPYTESYLPLGDLRLEFAGDESPSDYRRELDLDRAVSTVKYTDGGAVFTRETFASFPDQVIVMRLTCDQPGRVSFTASLDSLQRRRVVAISDIVLEMTGSCPSHVDPNYLRTKNPVRYDDNKGMTFHLRVAVVPEGGVWGIINRTVRITGNQAAQTEGALQISHANSVTIVISAATSFNGFDVSPSRSGKDPAIDCDKYLARAIGQTYDRLLKRHMDDYQNLYNRVGLDLGGNPAVEMNPTDDRLRHFREKDDPRLVALLFQFGRYLMISASRPGGQAMNLQGIWNDQMRPPWSSNYTININTEMNYWPAETCNLSECHQPLLELIRGLSVNGAKTAQVNYGLTGWVAHHNTDIWRSTNPVGEGSGTPVWANWPMGGAWLCRHLWEHFAFNGDLNYLRDFAWPILRGSAEFHLGWLIEDAHGHLVTAPSMSPELEFIAPDGRGASVSMASTMDMAITHDLFTNCIEAAELIGVDKGTDRDFVEKLRSAKGKLLPFQIGSRGQLQEWFSDFKETEVHHRHTSHLFGLHPGRQITPRKTPDLAKAVRRSLDIRGDGGTGWSLGWKINHWARLHEGDHAYTIIRNMLTLAGVADVNPEVGGFYPNLLDACPPFQIDGNFGFPAGIAEMLLQSHAGEIELLPALPTQWPNGHVKGLCARGGFTVDFHWESARLTRAVIASKSGHPCTIRLGEKTRQLTLKPGETVTLNAELETILG